MAETKVAVNRTASELEAEISELVAARRRALEAERAAASEIARTEERWAELALDLQAGEAGARLEAEGLEEAHSSARGKLRIAQAAASQAEQRVAALKEELSEAERHAHRERFDELGRELRSVLEQAEEHMGGLLENLAEAEDLHRRMHAASYAAGIGERYQTFNFHELLLGWFGARIGGVDPGYVPLPAIDDHYRKPLCELDPMAQAGGDS